MGKDEEDEEEDDEEEENIAENQVLKVYELKSAFFVFSSFLHMTKIT